MPNEREALVSIVIPAYNIEPYIAECVESVRRQTYQNLEIILVDDGSTDGTALYCDEVSVLDKRIMVIHQENGGVVAARDAGIKAAHGRYLGFVDGDDFIEPNMIEELVKQIGSSDMASAGVYQEQAPDYMIERLDRFQPGCYKGREMLSSIYRKMIYDQETGCLQPMTSWIYNKLYIREKARQIHQNISRNLIFAEDSVFLYRYMLECESITICDQCLYHYRYREGSAIHAVNEHMLTDIHNVYAALADIFRKHWMGTELLYQLQKWVSIKVCIAVNEMMGFDDRIYIPEFVLNTKDLPGQRLILYGAGRVGRDTFRQLQEFGYDVVLWVDREYRHYQKQGLPVQSPEAICRQSYDVIVIAIEDEKVAISIKNWLFANGISEEMIFWKKPLKLY